MLINDLPTLWGGGVCLPVNERILAVIIYLDAAQFSTDHSCILLLD